MSAEEQWLADLLKRTVPEPPRELSADEVTMRHVSRPHGVRSTWGLPALAASAMLIVGVGVGVAAHQWSSSVPSSPRPPFAPATSQGAGQPAPSRSPLRQAGREPRSAARGSGFLASFTSPSVCMTRSRWWIPAP